MKRIILIAVIGLAFLIGCNKDDDRIDSKTLSEITAVVPVSGALISLPNVAIANFGGNTFSNEISVTLSQTVTSNDITEFDIAEFMFKVKSSPNYEVRINTGQVIPSKPIHVSLIIPDEFIQQKASDFGFSVFGQLFYASDIEEIDEWDLIESDYFVSQNILQIDLQPEFFTNQRNTNGTFEAVLKIGITPGYTFGNRGGAGNDCSGGQFISCPTTSCIVTDVFGFRASHPLTQSPAPHKGIDLRAAVGSPIYAASDGIVTKRRYSPSFGNVIGITNTNDAGQSFATLYAHLDEFKVKLGDKVSEGDLIGLAGETGGAKGPHLHFEYAPDANLSPKGLRIDPKPLVNNSVPRLQSANAKCTALNNCATFGTLGSSWSVNFKFVDKLNLITSNSEVTFQQILPVPRDPFTVPVGSFASGEVISPQFCALFEGHSAFKVKAFITLPNGTQTNCIYFYLYRPNGANRSSASGKSTKSPTINL